jgi:mannose-6-phosphate isomerase-like protein (cupin superfamily)
LELPVDVEKFKEAVINKVYHLIAERKVALHQHPKHDEVFYCIKGSGFGVLENFEVALAPGKAFIVPAGTMHALRTDDELYVTSSLIPLAEDPKFAA